ncbi:fucolectin-like [Mytilus edulis]|uniref:fucolectin-like n=1 Tax=Mytilus edulis TaxID=6550 RepID=UPI0039F07F53
MQEYVILLLTNFILCQGLRENVALNKESRQSSTHYEKGIPGVSSLANDGNKHQSLEIPYIQLFCTHTMVNELNYWWAVDLGQEYSINSVTIFNRLDCCSDRLSDIYIYVYAPTIASWSYFDQESGQLCFYHPGLVPGIFSATCNRNLHGRYVKIYKDYGYNIEGDCLTLCEVEVYIDETPNTGTYCRQPNKEPLDRFENIVQHMSHTRCSLFCRQTEGCLGFSLATDNSCSLFKTSQQVEIITNVVDYYERC